MKSNKIKNESFEVQGILRFVENLKNSKDGNPRRLVLVGEHYAARTLPDAGLAYEIRAFYGKEVIATLKTIRGKLHVIDIRNA